VVVENNAGYSGPKCTLLGMTTPGGPALTFNASST
jgi:hypothetical protein